MIYFTVIYGLRRSEVLGLKWDSINWETDTVTIKHTVCFYGEIVEKDTTKTASSFRSYPLTAEVKTILKTLKNPKRRKPKTVRKSVLQQRLYFQMG